MKNEIIELTERLQRLEESFIEHRDNVNKNIVKLYDMVQNNDQAMIDMIGRIKETEDYINSNIFQSSRPAPADRFI